MAKGRIWKSHFLLSTAVFVAGMASKAIPGGVAVTDETWNQIKNRFEGQSLGELDIKGKGAIRVVAVQGNMSGV